MKAYVDLEQALLDLSRPCVLKVIGGDWTKHNSCRNDYIVPDKNISSGNYKVIPNSSFIEFHVE